MAKAPLFHYVTGVLCISLRYRHSPYRTNCNQSTKSFGLQPLVPMGDVTPLVVRPVDVLDFVDGMCIACGDGQ